MAQLLAATDAEDRAFFLDSSTEDGVVDDRGREFAGRFAAQLRGGKVARQLIRG